MSLTLVYPSEGSATISATMPNPEYGNIDRTDSNVINRESRHGTMLGYRDPTWPTIKTKAYTFKTMTKDEIDDLKAFLNTTAGLRIKLTDHNDEVFTGFIVTNDNEIITAQDNCSYDVSFEFMVN